MEVSLHGGGSDTSLQYTRHARERCASPTPSILAHLIWAARLKNLLCNLEAFAEFVDPRQITEDEILKVVRLGKKCPAESPTRTIHIGKELTVVTEKKLKKITTIITAFFHVKGDKKKLSVRRKEIFRKEALEMGNDAAFPQNVRKMVGRVYEKEKKMRKLHRGFMRDHKIQHLPKAHFSKQIHVKPHKSVKK